MSLSPAFSMKGKRKKKKQNPQLTELYRDEGVHTKNSKNKAKQQQKQKPKKYTFLYQNYFVLI